MEAVDAVVRGLGLFLVVSLICGVEIALESNGEVGLGGVVLLALVMGSIETLVVIVGG